LVATTLVTPARLSLRRLRRAFEASWDERTSYRSVVRDGNPAIGQCYPTARVVQVFYPEAEIARGRVATPDGALETHFWNVFRSHHIDLTWQQFPTGPQVCGFELLERRELGDGRETSARCDLLLSRVLEHLARQ